MRAHEKAAVGALGGLALVLLKLIEVKFLIHEPSSGTVLAAYLTYGAYITLGVIVAVFFTDESLAPDKTRKSAFVSGLLAPSVLLAVVSQGHVPSREPVDNPVIPKIVDLLIPSAHAQGVSTKLPLTELSRSKLDSAFFDGVKIASGQSPTAYYVLGESADKAKAFEYAAKVNKLLGTEQGAQIIHIADDKRWIVTLGEPGSRASLEAARKSVNKTALKAINGPQKDVAASLLRGQVIKGSALATMK
jgi:hypothetical protein